MDDTLVNEFAAFLQWKRQQDSSNPTIGELWEKWREWALDGNIRSWAHVRKPLELHILPHFGQRQWHTLSQEAWDEYIKWRRGRLTLRKRAPANSTINGELRAMKAMLNWHVDRKRIAQNPLAGISELPEENDRDFYLDDAQFARLLAHAKQPALRLILVVLFETGCRRDEIRCLELSEYHKALRAIALPASRTKTGMARLIPLSDLAIEAIEMAIQRAACVKTRFVFPSDRNPDKALTTASLWTWFQRALKSSGITGPRGQHVWLHTLRHSFASVQSQAGLLPTKEVMDILGHTKEEVHARYRHLSPLFRENARRALNARRTPEEIARIRDELRGRYDPK